MSASSKKKLRAEENAAKLTERQLAQNKEDKKTKAYTIAFGVVLALLVVVAAAVGVNRSIANSGTREKNTVALTLGDTTMSNAELSYYFIDTVNSFYSQNGSYLSLFGLDTGKALDQQVYNEETGETWADLLMEQALNTAAQTYAIYDEAIANGAALSEDDQSQIDTILSSPSARRQKRTATSWTRTARTRSIPSPPTCLSTPVPTATPSLWIT